MTLQNGIIDDPKTAIAGLWWPAWWYNEVRPIYQSQCKPGWNVVQVGITNLQEKRNL